ncbi:hypothetical protein EAH79_13085 [Sphingomonas koreensis]|nr:hypothetical protein EAH87_00755 [Sphingomonas koreensis]TPG39641.1 hypothetical protein EAH79_13085 [Sphingomonas koreensis]
MPHFHLHLIERSGVYHDSEGCELADDDAAVLSAIRQVRALVSHELRETGGIALDRAIDIVASDGRRVRRLAFPDAVFITPERKTDPALTYVS